MAIPLALVAIADLVSKRWVVMSLAPGDRRTLVNGIVSFVYVQNAHGAMGLFGERTGWLVTMALIVVALLAYLLRDGLRRSPYVQVGFGMVAGGALGNVVDRAIHGYVVDFISFWNFYVFNVADAFITIGLAAIVLGSRDSRRTATA